MAKRTTIFIPEEDLAALRAAARAEGISQSEFIRRSIRTATAAYRRYRPKPRLGILKLTRKEFERLLRGPEGRGSDFDKSKRGRRTGRR